MRTIKSMWKILLVGLMLICEIALQHHKETAANDSQQEVAVDNSQQETAADDNQQYVTADDSQQGNTDIELVKGIEIPAPLKGTSEQILRRTGYTTSYNSDTRCPNWTAWHLTADHTSGQFKRKGVKYREDDDVASPKAQLSDYSSSGYDRGHMCPSGDNKWDRQAQEDCFLLTNMCPQSHNLNGGDWNDLEMKCRNWAERYGDIYIVCGPVFDSGYKTIGHNHVGVPYAFYKVVLCMRGTPKAIGFLYENEDGHRPMSDYVLSVDEIERITGIDFFPSLPDDIEREIEAEADLSDW